MRFYCIELKLNFDSLKLAYLFKALGLTVVKKDLNFLKKLLTRQKNCSIIQIVKKEEVQK